MAQDDDHSDELEPNHEFTPPPWEATQFKVDEKRGRGRPKGARGERKIAEEVFLERHEVREDGQTKSLTALEIIIKVLRNASLHSDRAYAAVQDLIERHTPQSREPRRILALIRERIPVELWEERFEHLTDRD